MALTAKQDLFCLEYMKDLNATQAAIRAGYSKNTAKQIGTENLSKPAIRARIDELMEVRKEKVEFDAHWVLARLAQVVDRSMSAVPVMKWDPDVRMMVESGEFQFDSRGANQALEMIGKHLAMFKDKVEVSGDLNVIKVTMPKGPDEDADD